MTSGTARNDCPSELVSFLAGRVRSLRGDAGVPRLPCGNAIRAAIAAAALALAATAPSSLDAHII